MNRTFDVLSAPWQAFGTYVSKLRPSGYTLPITRVYNVKHGSPGIEPDMTVEEAEAVAHLIAAAPDLLAACQAISAKYQELYDGMDTDYAAFFTALGKEVGAARQAMAKAEKGNP